MNEKLRDKILRVLAEFPKSRDSDVWLTLKIWSLYYPSRIDRSDPNNSKVSMSDILNVLPREDIVKRIRAKIQNEENLYLPLSAKVRRRRKINEDKWRAWSKNPLNLSTPIVIT